MEPSKSWTRLGETVEELLNPYRSSYPDVQFQVENIPADTVIKIDKHRFTQLLTNLLINAIDAMECKGLVEIRCDIVKKREIKFCRIAIRDTGKGIPKSEGPNIFTPYFTTKESGTGLGLPIVERIVNDHGGAIWFNSMEGKGTVFFVDLPVNEEE
jgi:signal transduction histidine kinase